MPKPSGVVCLCRNAVIDNSYSSTIDFKSSSEQLSYWSSLVKYRITDFMYIRRTRGYIKVNKSLNDLEDVNYLYFTAEEDNKRYYCFVTSKEYIDDLSSYIYFETDVLQSYMFDYEVKESYVLQEHTDRWTVDHSPIFNRVEEGLEYGSEYTVEQAYNIEPTKARRNSWYLAVLTPGFTVADGGKINTPTVIDKVPNPYVYLLCPSETVYNSVIVKDGSGNAVSKLVGTVGELSYIMSNSTLSKFVQQVIRLPYLPFDFGIYENNVIDTTTDPSTFNAITLSAEGATGYNMTFIHIKTLSRQKLVNAGRPTNKEYFRELASLGLFEGIENSLPTAEQWAEIKANPYTTPRDKRFESKLLAFPYRYNILTDWKNNPLIIKNEYVGADKIKVNMVQSIAFNGGARYWVDNYRKDPEGRRNNLVQPIQEDIAIVTPEYYSYLLQNRNQLQTDLTNLKINNDTKLFMQAGTGIVGSAMSGSAGGVVTGILETAVGAVNNKVYGDTNYNNLVRSQNAKASDLKNLPDTIVTSNDGTFSVQDDNKYLSFYRMKICCEFEELLADTFAMTGYTVKRVKLPNLRTRARYNYVKTIGANIVGSFNQDDLRRIRAIFDNGVTFWHYNAVNFKPYDYSYENIETSLI